MTDEWIKIVKEELQVAESVLPYVEADPLQGWHVEGDFYSFNAEMIREKIRKIREMIF